MFSHHRAAITVVFLAPAAAGRAGNNIFYQKKGFTFYQKSFYFTIFYTVGTSRARARRCVVRERFLLNEENAFYCKRTLSIVRERFLLNADDVLQREHVLYSENIFYSKRTYSVEHC